MSALDDDLADAIAILARGLQGAIQHARDSGIEHLPRPSFSAPPLAPAERGATPPADKAPAAPAAPTRPAPTQPAPTQPAPTQPSPMAGAADAAPSALQQTSGSAAPEAAPPATPARQALPVLRGPSLGGVDVLQAILSSTASNADKLELLRTEAIGDCTRCKLHRGRSRLVFGVGNPNAMLVFVGEGPGADEDRQGVPFVGKAGQLLTRMIEAMGLKRDDVYICNVVKCRPPSNRDPEPDEVDACEPFLQAQLAILQPRVIVALGRHAAQTLLRTKTPITRLRGNWCEYRGIALMPTYHPSYLLREESDPSKQRKREAWADLQEVMKHFGLHRPS